MSPAKLLTKLCMEFSKGKLTSNHKFGLMVSCAISQSSNYTNCTVSYARALTQYKNKFLETFSFYKQDL